MAPTRFISALMLTGFQPTARAGGFLEQSTTINTDDVQDMLTADLSPSSQFHVNMVREKLRPLYDALPKNKQNQLDPATVRYALHRFFVQEYGWYVKGVDPADVVETTISPHAEILKDRVPHYLQSLLAQRMHGTGLDIEGTAVFATTLQDLIEKEVTDGLHQIYDTLEMSPSNASESEVERALKSQLSRLFSGPGSEKLVSKKSGLAAIDRELRSNYEDWPKVVEWMKDSHQTFLWNEKSRRNPFHVPTYSFDGATSALKGMMHRIDDVGNQGCHQLKDELVDLEYKGTGRVRVRDYYNGKKDPETLEYLRHVGVLDESDPKMPMILIPNYIQSKANCIVESNYFSLCCMNECESLLRHIEFKLRDPSVSAESITRVVSDLASDTVSAGRNLSSSLRNRLDQIAQYHGGKVPLHGRLFAQWMHHAYPRECAYPHHEKRETPMTQDEWLQSTNNVDALAKGSEKRKHSSMEDHFNSITDDNLPWHMTEELVHDVDTKKGSFGMVRGLAAIVALVSMASPLIAKSQKLASVTVVSKQHLV